MKKLSTSKKLVIFLFINCTAIEIFTMVCEILSIIISLQSISGLTPDFSPLVALIGAVVGETIGFAVYSIKSAKENCQGGIVYDTTMKNLDPENISNISG